MKKKVINKKIIIVCVFALLILGISIFINNAFFKPTKLNAFVAAKIYNSPANTLFTDDNFYNCVVDAYNDKNNTDEPYTTNLSESQLSTIENLLCLQTVNEVDGIEKLSNLKKIQLNANNLLSIDISNNQLLEELDLSCSNNSNIDIIDFKNNKNLKKLDVSGIDLTEIDLSNNSFLTELDISSTNISTIDLSNLNELVKLNINFTNINEIKLENLSHLKYLDTAWSLLTSLDVSENTKLEEIIVGGNGRYGDNGYEEIIPIDNINLTNNINLKKITIWATDTTDFDFTNNINLEELFINGHNISSINLSKNINLTKLSISNNTLEKLDVSNNINLTEIAAGGNKLSIVDLGNLKNLKHLNLRDNNLQTLDVNNNLELESLDVTNNQLQNIILNDLEKLSALRISYNNINELDISDNLNLKELNAFEVNFKSLDFSKYKNLSVLNIGPFVRETYTYRPLKYEPDVNEIYNIITLPNKIMIDSTNSGFVLNDYTSGFCYDWECNAQYSGFYTVKTRFEDYVNGQNSYKIHIINNFYVGGINSSKYNIDETNSTIDLGNDLISESIKNNISACYIDSEHICELDIVENKLNVSINENHIKTFELVTTGTNFEIVNTKISNTINKDENLYKGYDGNIKIDILSANIPEESKFNITIYNSNNENVTDMFEIETIENNHSFVIHSSETLEIGKYTVEINVEDINKSFTFQIYEPTLVTDINISDITLGINGALQNIEYIIIPENATNKELTFEIQDETIAKLDSDNKIYGIKEGNTTLTLTTTDGSNIQKTVNVNVYDFGVKSENYDVSKPNIINKIGNNTFIDCFKSNIITNSLITTKIYKNNMEIDVSTKIGTGQILKTYINDELLNEYKLIVSGDINGDGQANATDILKMKMHILGKSTLEDIIFTAGDIDENNSVNATDIIYLKRYILGKTDNVWGS